MTLWQPGARLSRLARHDQTYRNILYLLLAFPLGTTYFVVLVVGLSTGAGLAVVGIGLLLLLYTLGFAWMMAAVERYLVAELLRVDIVPASGPPFPFKPRWQPVVAQVRRPLTWKSLSYLLLEFPFGVMSFTVTVTLLAVSLSLLFYPVGVCIDLAFNSGAAQVDNFTGFGVLRIIWQHTPRPLAVILDAILFPLIPVLGVAATAGSLRALNAMAQGWGQFARVMLSMSAAEQELMEARERAAREQARAERADRRRRELIVNVGHELRTPISHIIGHVDSLLMPLAERLSESEKQGYLEIVAREARRLGALVDDLLALARADADELRLDIRPIDISAVVEEVYQALAPLARRDRQVSMVRNIAPDLPCALADRDRLAQVILNLARNAITATPEGGLVFLDLERAGLEQLRITVSDSGHGIPPEDLEMVFERFYRADASRQRATGGFGLGLSIVRDLVQAMGGKVTASSTVDVGSNFQVLLRVATATDQPATAPDESALPGARAG